MPEMITFETKQTPSIIKVLGVGGGGSNAVNHMFKQGIKGVDFAVCNTDVQALHDSPVPIKIEIGSNGGLGAGSKPEVGCHAAEESIDKIKEIFNEQTQMLFITAGMGGGTGTGAAPVIAKLAREMGILTVGIVTLPFAWEGRRRTLQAQQGVEEIKQQVDTLLVINNDKLRVQYGNLSVKEAFAKADNVLTIAAKGIAEIITATGKVNTDFEDVKTVIKDSGKAIMGQAVAEGENRAMMAIEEAMSSPLLNDNDINGATNILLHIVSGTEDITMDEISEITEYVQDASGHEADVIWGLGDDDSLGNNIGITIIATGFDSPNKVQVAMPPEVKKTHKLYEKEETKSEMPEIVFGKADIKTVEKEEKVEPKTEIEIDSESKNIVETKEKPEITLINESVPPIPESGPDFSKKPKVVHQLGEEKEDTVDEEKEDSGTFTLIRKVKPVESKNDFSVEDREENTTIEQENDYISKKSAERINKLKSMSMSFRNPSVINELENKPAYARKNIELSEPNLSSDSVISRHTLGEDSKSNTIIKSDNSFLHDNID